MEPQDWIATWTVVREQLRHDAATLSGGEARNVRLLISEINDVLTRLAPHVEALAAMTEDEEAGPENAAPARMWRP